MDKPLAPEVRAQFAKRLKDMRVQSGFLRARYFANSLGIEENRYTRYERAEVEPSLSLIQKMCETLRVSPNELLGFAEFPGPSGGFAETPQREAATPDATVRRPDLLAWRLASEVVAVRSKQHAIAKAAGDPLAAARETGSLFQRLQSDPFGTVAEIVADDALKDLDAERKTEFAEIIAAFTESVTDAPNVRR
jgi:transcriptional regulator with XRE-family HTH domain